MEYNQCRAVSQFVIFKRIQRIKWQTMLIQILVFFVEIVRHANHKSLKQFMLRCLKKVRTIPSIDQNGYLCASIKAFVNVFCCW